jgi:hypothetical protein
MKCIQNIGEETTEKRPIARLRSDRKDVWVYFGEIDLNVDGTSAGSCPVVYFNIIYM